MSLVSVCTETELSSLVYISWLLKQDLNLITFPCSNINIFTHEVQARKRLMVSLHTNTITRECEVLQEIFQIVDIELLTIVNC